MITQIANFHLFYPMLFTAVIVFIIAVCNVIKSRNSNMTFKDMFCKSSDNSKDIMIDTTSKMASMHDKVIPLQYTSIQEHELHSLECNFKQLKQEVDDLKEKVDLLFDRIIK